jgi:arylsulfatase A-like enzyme
MSEKPNVLLFIADGMQACTIDPDSACLTPNFDRLGKRGVQFGRAYCATPVCSPSRASLMTGLLPHNHGVLEVSHGRGDDQCMLRKDKAHFAQRLVESGYSTAYFGKWHIERSNRLEDFGWQVNRVKSDAHVKYMGVGDDGGLPVDPELSGWVDGPVKGYNRILHYGVTDVPPADRYAHKTVDEALEYLGSAQSAADPKPWCTCVSFSEPNEALVVSRETFNLYDVDSIELPVNLRDDYSGKPNLYQREGLISQGVSDHEWRMALACYYGRITEVDAQLGRLLDWLENSGKMENTVVIATADHGRYVGSHGFDAHNFGAFEEIYRVPLTIAGPGIAAGVDSNALVSLPDLCPTILELTAANPILELDAQSFVEVLRNPEGKEAIYSSAYGEYHGTRFPLCQRILWEGDWKFVFNGFDFDELYHLKNDPAEMNNLAARPDQQERVEHMMAGIWKQAKESGDRTIVESHYYSMRFAVVGPNTE